MEILFRLLTNIDLLSSGFMRALLFTLSIAILFYLLSRLFKNFMSVIIASALLLLTSILYISQYLYFSTFRTFYSVYSASNHSQIADFQSDIINIIVQNVVWILLFIAPVLILLLIGKRYFLFGRIQYRPMVLSLLCIGIIQAAGIATMLLGEKGQHSAYDLYFQNRNHVLSTDRLGLMTTMRIDLQRHIFGWSPTLTVTAPPLPDLGETIDEPLRDIKNDASIVGGELMDRGKDKQLQYNVIDIDFEQLIVNEDDETIIELHRYFSNAQPTHKNEYTGQFEGYNLILITAESYAPYAVDKDITPTLYKMLNEGYHFTNFYTNLWENSTTDGEYVALTGLLPKSGVWSFTESASNYLPFTMGKQFEQLGYYTVAYHNHTYTYYNRDRTHPNMGYDYKGIGNGLDVSQIWPASDLEMMKVSLPEFIDEEPFHAYYLTMSGHMQYSFDGNNMARKNREVVKHLPYSEQGQAYLATHVELDRALEHLLAELEKAGIDDRTLIALSSDHYPYGLDDETIEELSGERVNDQFDLYRNDFIIYTKGIEPKKIDTLGSSLDIIPTLSNLLGLEYDSRLIMGRDIFSDSKRIVPFLDRSFVTEKGVYNAVTGEFKAFEDANVDDDYIQWGSAYVNSQFYYSAKILDYDYYRIVLKNE